MFLKENLKTGGEIEKKKIMATWDGHVSSHGESEHTAWQRRDIGSTREATRVIRMPGRSDGADHIPRTDDSDKFPLQT